jgi:hypothetical protein
MMYIIVIYYMFCAITKHRNYYVRSLKIDVSFFHVHDNFFRKQIFAFHLQCQLAIRRHIGYLLKHESIFIATQQLLIEFEIQIVGWVNLGELT